MQQDWEPVVLRRPGTAPVKKGPSGAPPKIIRDDIDVFHHKQIPKELAGRIAAKRILMKLSQDQLAQKVNLRPAVVKDIESCKGPYNHVDINKVLNFLGLTK